MGARWLKDMDTYSTAWWWDRGAVDTRECVGAGEGNQDVRTTMGVLVADGRWVHRPTVGSGARGALEAVDVERGAGRVQACQRRPDPVRGCGLDSGISNQKASGHVCEPDGDLPPFLWKLRLPRAILRNSRPHKTVLLVESTRGCVSFS
jgi:hypothetical protein